MAKEVTTTTWNPRQLIRWDSKAASDELLRSLGYIRLNEVVYDQRARDGTWCRMPYPMPHPLHKKGCPNFPDCPASRPDFKKFTGYRWIAVVEEFDLKAHAEMMRINSEERRDSDISSYMVIWNAISVDDVLRIAKEKKVRIPKVWTDLQCRCVLYWQPSVEARLRKKAESICFPIYGDVLLDVPEASGVDLFKTMPLHGIVLEKNPDHVYKIMLVGKPQT